MASRSGSKRTRQTKRAKLSRHFLQESSEKSESNHGHQRQKDTEQTAWEEDMQTPQRGTKCNSNMRKRSQIWPQRRQQTDRQWQSFPLATQHWHINCVQQQRLSQRCNSVYHVAHALQRHGQWQNDSSGDKQVNNTNTIWAATLRHWIQMDIVGRMDITPVRVTMEHRATIPCQYNSVQPPELIRWEETRRTNRSDMQGRT